MNILQAAEQFRRAVQLFAGTLDEAEALEIATVYESWKTGKYYPEKTYLTYGTNSVGDPQLYRVNAGKGHTSQIGWTPDITPDLYTAIGLDDNGYPVWTAPTGAQDAYNVGDIVNHEGTLYISNINGNTTVPGTDNRWWSVYDG